MNSAPYSTAIDSGQYAARHRVDERTVQRWAKAGELPGATKGADGRWYIPEDAMRIKPLPGTAPTAMSPTRRDDIGVVADASPTRRDDIGASLADALAVRSAFLTLEDAAMLLGVPEASIRRDPDRFRAERIGVRRALMVPARVVREEAGL